MTRNFWAENPTTSGFPLLSNEQKRGMADAFTSFNVHAVRVVEATKYGDAWFLDVEVPEVGWFTLVLGMNDNRNKQMAAMRDYIEETSESVPGMLGYYIDPTYQTEVWTLNPPRKHAQAALPSAPAPNAIPADVPSDELDTVPF